MAITQAMCTSFKKELLEGIHDFRTTGDTFKIALFTSSATLSAATTAYAVTNEVSGTGYTAGGNTLSKTAYTDFSDTTWSSATITANGALIYNSTDSNAAVVVLAFGGDKTSTNGDFTIQFPAAGASTAIIRIA
jgi:hypothetical protein